MNEKPRALGRAVMSMAFCILAGALEVRASDQPLTGVRKEVWSADVAFDQAAADGDLQRFAALVADDAIFLGSGVLEGKEAIVAAWAPLFAENRTTVLRWQPHTVEVSASGDLGYTIGTFEMTATLPDGAEVKTGGSYVSIWRKGEDGQWRAVVDAGTPPE